MTPATTNEESFVDQLGKLGKRGKLPAAMVNTIVLVVAGAVGGAGGGYVTNAQFASMRELQEAQGRAFRDFIAEKARTDKAQDDQIASLNRDYTTLQTSIFKKIDDQNKDVNAIRLLVAEISTKLDERTSKKP